VADIKALRRKLRLGLGDERSGLRRRGGTIAMERGGMGRHANCCRGRQYGNGRAGQEDVFCHAVPLQSQAGYYAMAKLV